MSSRKQKKSPTTEKAFSQEDFRGITQRLAREDHTHGTPANPSDAHVAGEDPHTQYRLESEDHSHEASGVPGGQLDHGNAMVAASLQDDDHPQYIKHSLATAVSDFLVASGAGVFVKKTLAEVKTILSLGSAAYTDSGDYAIAAKGVTNGDSHDHVGGDGAQIDHGGLGGLGDDDHTQYVLVDNSRMSTGEYRHVGDLADDATFDLPAVTNGGMGLMVAGADEERAQFSIKSDGTVNLIIASANVVANVDTDAKVCIGTSVASPCVIKNRLGGTKAILLQLWYN